MDLAPWAVQLERNIRARTPFAWLACKDGPSVRMLRYGQSNWLHLEFRHSGTHPDIHALIQDSFAGTSLCFNDSCLEDLYSIAQAANLFVLRTRRERDWEEPTSVTAVGG